MRSPALLPSALLVLGYVLGAITPRPLSEALLLAFLVASVGTALTFWRSAPLLLFTGSLIGLAFEILGLSTGLPFGSYSYRWTAPRILGVPVPVVVAWGMYIYTFYLSSLPLPSRRGRAVATALYMVFLDLGVDPVMVEKGLWVWKASGPDWFGVPVSNFAGWGLVTATAVLVYQKVVKSEPRAPPISSFTAPAACLAAVREATASTLLPAVTSLALLATLSTVVYVLSEKNEYKTSYAISSPPRP